MKTALVTGGSSGIGRAIAERLRADGNHVATIDLTESDTDFSYVADVTDRGQIDAALDAARSALGPITILINAAGMTSFRRFTNLTSTNGRRSSTSTSTASSTSPRRCCPTCWRPAGAASSTSRPPAPIPVRRTRRLRGSQVRGQRSDEIPCAGIRSARHHRQRGAAGIHRHPDAAECRRRDCSADRSTTSSRTHPCAPSRLPEDIAAACAFLVSEEAGYITGQIVGVNGGRCT